MAADDATASHSSQRRPRQRCLLRSWPGQGISRPTALGKQSKSWQGVQVHGPPEIWPCRAPALVSLARMKCGCLETPNKRPSTHEQLHESRLPSCMAATDTILRRRTPKSMKAPDRPFIIFTTGQAADSTTRKLIRSHVMQGKNRTKKSRSQAKTASALSLLEPPTAVPSLQYCLRSALAGIRFADEVEPAMLADVVVCKQPPRWSTRIIMERPRR